MQFSSILWNSGKNLWNLHRKLREWSKHLQNLHKIWIHFTNCSKSVQRSANISDWVADLCRFWKMLQNATTLAIVAVHSADNEPPSVSKMWTFGHSLVSRVRFRAPIRVVPRVDFGSGVKSQAWGIRTHYRKRFWHKLGKYVKFQWTFIKGDPKKKDESDQNISSKTRRWICFLITVSDGRSQFSSFFILFPFSDFIKASPKSATNLWRSQQKCQC